MPKMRSLMIELVLSGGQTGADQAGWRVARAFGIPTGGAMPTDFLTEDGPRPDFAELYGAVAMATASYAARTERNVRDADATLWFGDPTTPGGKSTLKAVAKLGKHQMVVVPGDNVRPSHVVDWLGIHLIRTINIAGNRASKAPDLADRVERFLSAVFHQLGHRPA